uniref:Cytochrome P450 oxidase 74A1-like protein n=1 Tax=Platycodon grandiflorus TaxID=94286 RepID=A0A2I7M6E9_PLAGD|nr:cytochrome P450 oxidase 74A1-like protein [Platycodon grandiflorus]
MSTSNPLLSELPHREIPGTYGPAFFGPIKDRYDYFYCQGREEFFKSRIQKYDSTVFRTNMPPGPFISSNSKVIAVLDAVSFPILFNTDKVEKKDVFVGTYMPHLDFYGGYRPLAYLDPSEPQHKALKSFLFALFTSLHRKFIPNFQSCLFELFTNLENEISEKNIADFNTNSESISFDFVFNMFTERYPSESPIGSSGPEIAKRWVTLQLAPIGTLGNKYIPSFIDDLLVHTVQLPFFLVKSDYEKLYHAFYALASSVLDQAEKVGIRRGEACHNLVFISAFNSFGGMMVLFPTLIKWVAYGGEDLHRRLAEEIRAIVKTSGVSFIGLEKMALTKSVVYETLRIEPPVPYQYGRAKEDLVINSHDASFVIKKGEMIFGYQPLATKDPKVFVNPNEFVADRFVGEEGEKLKKYVYWSNGRETDDPTPDDKQCPGKDLVILWCRLLLVEFFLRYDTFTAESGENTGFGPPVKITSLRKAN